MTTNEDVTLFVSGLLNHHNAWFFGTKLDEPLPAAIFLSSRHKRPRHGVHRPRAGRNRSDNWKSRSVA